MNNQVNAVARQKYVKPMLNRIGSIQDVTKATGSGSTFDLDFVNMTFSTGDNGDYILVS